jgi:hypothetical protein
MMTHKQIEAGLRSQAVWHNTKAERLAHLAYRANNDAFRNTMLARAEEHSKQAVEAMKNASEMISDEAAAKKQPKKRKEKPSKKQRTSRSRKR